MRKTKTLTTPFSPLEFILSTRSDLRLGEGFDLGPGLAGFLGWLVTSGVTEYGLLREEPALISGLLERLDCPPGVSRLAFLLWRGQPALQAAFPLPGGERALQAWFYLHALKLYRLWPLLTEQEQRAVRALPEPHGSAVLAAVLEQLPAPVRERDFAARDFGVNVVGYAFGQLGIGEDARMAARALLAAEVPMAMLDFPPGADIPCNDRSMAAHVRPEGGFAFNFFCLTAEETGRFCLERGRRQFAGRYNIGYWPWELSAWPKDWEMLLDLVDEVWVSTQHTYEALRPVCSKPLLVMPMAVELGEVRDFGDKAGARAHFALPLSATLFCFAFDLNSSVDRKNPQACVEAFLAAFPRERFGADAVGLVIKVHRPRQRNRAWEKLKRLAREDDRLHIIESTLPRPDLLALYAACDCFVSLHRAEGFGRGLAEALQLGLHVICTAYSGNVDFCQPPYASLVDFALVKVKKNAYPHAAGQVWAEPDVEHAASLMRAFVDSPPPLSWQSWPQFSVATVGRRYRERLWEIRAAVKGAELENVSSTRFEPWFKKNNKLRV
jgi:glycosyltransferase involved in cell wall biosynthesis